MADSSVGARLLLGDCIAGMAGLEAESVDAIVSDPPYGLEFMGAEWDKFGASITRLGFDARPDAPGVPPFGRGLAASLSFQEFSERWGREALRVLKPGGHLLAFGGSRTYHRLAAGIEDAGFEVRDQLMWLYGEGFPKSLDVSKAIDAKLGAARDDRVVSSPGGNKVFSPSQTVVDPGKPITGEARQWSGWGTALKPSHEPIMLARKPLVGTVAETVLQHGTGALNTGSSKIGTTGGQSAVAGTRTLNPNGATDFPGRAEMLPSGGRWPANVLLGHLPECEGSGADHTAVLCAPGCPVAELNEMSADAIVGGGAARFFYIAKPRRRERIGGTIRNLHPTVKPIDLMRHLVRLVTPPGGTVLDPFLGSGTTGCAAMIEGFNFFGIERAPEHYELALARISDYAFAHGRVRPSQS